MPFDLHKQEFLFSLNLEVKFLDQRKRVGFSNCFLVSVELRLGGLFYRDLRTDRRNTLQYLVIILRAGEKMR